MENQIRISNGNSSFSFFPRMGAALNKLFLGGKSIFRSANNEEQFQHLTKECFNGSQLFPFPNRLKDGKYSYNGTSYELYQNEKDSDHALHGLVYDQSFWVLDVDSGAFVKTASVLEGHEGYPFTIHLLNQMTLKPNSLSIKTAIKNIGESSVPIGHGWHTYFSGSGHIDVCKLRLPSKYCLEVDDSMIPTGEFLPFQDFHNLTSLKGKKLDTCVKLEDNLGSILFENPDEGFTVKTEVEGYDYAQLYIPPDKNCIAIEPQSCAPDAFNNRLGLIELEPEESRSFHMRISLT